MAETIHVFWDNSNIFIPAKYIADKRDGLHAFRAVRVSFVSLFDLARAGRTVRKGFALDLCHPSYRECGTAFVILVLRLNCLSEGRTRGRSKGWINVCRCTCFGRSPMKQSRAWPFS